MQHTPTPVKVTGQKTDRRELRYQKLCASIERLQRKVDKADRTFQRGTRQLVKLERQRRRAQLALAKPRPEPKPADEHPRIEAKQEAVANSLVEDVPPKPPRKRPRTAEEIKPGDPGPQLLADLMNRPFVEARQAREAKMKAAGFRKVSRDRKAPPAETA